MKKLITVALAVFWYQMAMAQDQKPVYMIFEFMRVDNEQEGAYAQTENFWEKIHQERVNNGDLLEWNFWVLFPGGEDQTYQYLIVDVFDDPVQMMKIWPLSRLVEHAKKAYPDMSEEQIAKKLNQAAETRDIAVRLYTTLVETTTDDFNIPVGSVARINMMKIKDGQHDAYVKAEREVFKPMHQQMVDAGQRASWDLAQVMIPYGEEAKADYITVDLYKDDAQMFGELEYEGDPTSAEQQKAMEAGVATRDLKYGYMGRLLKKARKVEN